MNIENSVTMVTGAASGIGGAVASAFAARKARGVVLVDRADAVHETAESIRKENPDCVCLPFTGDVTDPAFRREVFDRATADLGLPRILVPAAGITRDRLSVKLDKETGKADIYPIENFRLVTEINLIAPIYWALELIRAVAESRWAAGNKRWSIDEGLQGAIVFIGSVSSQGNRGQVSYGATKAGLAGAGSALTKEAMFFGVRCGVIHPGFTDTPMVRAMGEDYIEKHILPATQLGRLIRPDEIADAICFMVSNSAVTGELWADAGWHPAA
ncbi:MAG: SDR family oxidoreductase [Verrucomicrobiae bacterium]|nr:SDR family oxidoreductase [Verrucomicrobiae bacterium]MCP5539898.1 SDR family oxidoreductase [Akkermansiaceae bacterium]